MPGRLTRKGDRPAPFALLTRAAAGIALVAYVLVFSGSSIGHGWYLMVHLAQHHGGSVAQEAVPSLADPTPLMPAQGHRHGNGPYHTHEPAPGHLHKHHQPKPAAAVHADALAPHEHGGKVHTHEKTPESHEVLYVILLLDQHCLFATPTVHLALPGRDAGFNYTPPAHLQLALPVELPPPRPVA